MLCNYEFRQVGFMLLSAAPAVQAGAPSSEDQDRLLQEERAIGKS